MTKSRAIRLWGQATFLLALAIATGASAITDGVPPQLFSDSKGQGGRSVFVVRGSAASIGDSLLSIGDDQYVNKNILSAPEAEALLSLPNDASVVAAYLFWAASANAAPLAQPAPSVSVMFYTPSGASLSGSGINVTANSCQTFASLTNQSGDTGPSFACRADVTDVVKAHPPSVLSSNGASLEGLYSVDGNSFSNLRPGRPGSGGIGSCDNSDRYSCQSAFAGWTLVVVYASPTAPSSRDVAIYDGFLRLDEVYDFNTGSGTSGIAAPQTLGGFVVGPSHQGELTFFGMEGDPQLGFDGNDASGNPFPEPANNSDFIQLGGNDLRGGVPWPPSTANMLQGPGNPWGNLFNSSGAQSVSHRGIDFDKFNISTLLTPNQTTITFQPGSGDGVPNPGYSSSTHRACPSVANNGTCGFGDIVLSNGEYFLLGWTMLALDTVAPDFSTSTKTVDTTTVTPGDVLTFTIKVVNTAKATTTTVQDALPANVTYVPNSTAATVPGTGVTFAIPDKSGQSGLANGGFTVPLQVGAGSVREVDFTLQARVNASTEGQQVCNSAFILSSEISTPVKVTTSPCARVASPTLDRPQLTVRINGQASASAPHTGSPGDTLTYVATLTNSGDASAHGVAAHVDLPPFTKNFSLLAQGDPNATLASSPTSFDLTGITIAAHSSIQLVWQVTVFSAAEFQAAGVQPNSIDGQQLPEQLTEKQGSFTQLSDDPAVGGAADATTVVMHFAVDLSGSAKTAQGGSGGFVQPGDTITWTIDLKNPGNRAATLSISDPLPSGVTNCAVVQPASATCAGGQLTVAGLALPAGGEVQIVFTVQVRSDAANGLLIQNIATATAPELSGPVTLPSNALTVRAVVDLTSSAKTVRDVSSGASVFLPGDIVEYTIKLTNSGTQSATQVRVDDPIPANLTFIPGSAQPAASFDGAALHWTLADLAGGQGDTLVFRATIAPAVPNNTQITNTAHGSSAQATVDMPVTFRVTSSPLFTASAKTVQDVQGHPLSAVKPGDDLLYTLTIQNTGNAPATNVSVSDPLDPLLTWKSGGAFANGAVSWTVPGTMNPGDTVTLQFSAQLAPAIANGTRIDNSALVSATELAQPQRTQVASVTVASTGSLSSSTKTAQVEAPGTPLPGRHVTYTFTLSVTGDSPADDVVLTDPLASCLVNPVPGNGGVVQGTSVRWDKTTTPSLGHILPGQSVIVSLVAQISPSAQDGSACDNVGHLVSGTVPATDTSVAHLVIVSKPELSKSTKAVALTGDKQVPPDGKFSPGDHVQYTFSVQNTGTATASNVVLTDTLPAQLTNTTAIPAIGSLAAGATRNVTIDADIAAGTPNGTQVCNTGQLSTPELTGSFPTTQACFTVDSHPDLTSFTKTLAGSRTRRPGDTLVYTLTLQNSGTAPATQVKVADPLDSHLSFVSATASDGGASSFDVATASVRVSWASALQPGQSFTVTLTAKLATVIDNGIQVPNQAHASAAELPAQDFLSDDPLTGAKPDPLVVTVISGADLGASTKTVTRVPAGAVHPGDKVHYDLAITNTGDADARSVVVTDPVDARLAVVTPVPNGGLLTSGGIVWTLPQPLHPGDPPVLLSFDAVVQKPLPNGTVISNQASLTAQGLAQPQQTDDPSLPGPHDPTSFTIVSAPDLSTSSKAFLDTTRSDGTVHPGDSITFTVQPANTGDAETTQTTVTDVLDASLVFVSAGQGGTYTAATRTVSWTLPRVGLTPQAPLTFIATVVKPLVTGTVVKNVARFTAAELAGPVSTNTVQFTVISAPDLSQITKTLQSPPQVVRPGTVLAYSIRVPNSGDANATNLVITDAIDPGLDTISPLDGGTLSGGVLTWTVPTLAPGAAATVRFSARVKPLTANGTVISNQAQAACQEATTPQLSDDPGTPAPHDPTRVTVTSAPDLSTTAKTAQVLAQPVAGLLRPGDTLRYTIAVQNTGDTWATHVVVRDPLDALLTAAVPADGGALQGGAIVWSSSGTPALARLAPGVTVTLHFDAKVSAAAHDGDFIVNQASMTEDENLPFVSDDPGTPALHDATKLQVRFADLRADLAAQAVVPRADGTIHPTDLVDFVLKLTNKGSFPGSHVTVRLPVDANLVDIIPQGAGLFSAGRIDWSETSTPALASMAPGATITLGMRARIKPLTRNNTQVTEQAQINATELLQPAVSNDPATPVADDPTIIIIHSAPDLRATTKAVKNTSRADGTYRPGDRVEYDLVVRNVGDTWADHAIVRDTIDAGLDAVTLITGGSFNGTTIQWTATDVAALSQVNPGDTVPLSFTARVKAGDKDGQLVSNQALLTSAELLTPQVSDDPATPAASDPTVFSVLAGPRLGHSIKTVSNITTPGSAVRPGDVLEYEIHVINDGSDPALNTVLTDAPPPQTRYVAGSTTVNNTGVGDLPSGQSALENGVRVQSPGSASGTILSGTGFAAVVHFRVRVSAEAIAGTVIANQGQLRADKIPQASTDDPATPTEGDATIVVVGSAPLLQSFKSWRLVADAGTPNVVDPGDTVEYAIAVTNRGGAAAHSVLIDDPIPAGATYVPGSLQLDGRALTDSADNDEGTALATGHNTFKVALLAPAQTVRAVFRVRAGTTALVNQASISSADGLSVLSDGDPTLPGEQPTVTPVGSAAELRGSKSVTDLNGGDVVAGDELLYSITLINDSAQDVTTAIIDDPIPQGLAYVDGSARGDGTVQFFPGTTDPGSVRATGVTVKASGGRAQLSFRVRVLDGIAPGSVLRNVATVRRDGAAPRITLPEATVIIGQAQGTGGVQGKVFQDLDGNGTPSAKDRMLPGFQVLLRRPQSPQLLRSSLADGQGGYKLGDLPPGSYELEVLSPEGTHFAQRTRVVSASDSTGLDVQVSPYGQLYRTSDLTAVSGARVFLRYDDSAVGKPLPSCELGAGSIAKDQLVGDGCLGTAQQGQRTGALGLYRFDPLAGGDFRLDVDPGTPLLAFPSAKIAPDAGVAQAGPVIPEPQPENARAPHWFRRLELAAGKELSDNHLALDASGLRLTKVAARTTASVGDLVSYTVTVQNPTAQDLRVDAATNTGGLHLFDALPDGFHYASGSARALRLTASGRACARVTGSAASCAEGAVGPAASENGKRGAVVGRFLDFGAYDLLSGETLELRYTALVGTATQPGDAVNHAVARVNGVEVSNADSVTVRIAQDPIFDLASLIGKVSCTDGEGVPGAKIWEDEGFLAETDASGKFHFKGLQPGLHRFKIDPRSLPPGSEPLDNGAFDLYLTRGLDARQSFSVLCRFVTAGPDSVKRKLVPAPPPPPAAPLPPLRLSGDVASLSVAIDGVPLPLPMGDVRRDGPGFVIAGEPVRLRPLLVTGPSPTGWRVLLRDSSGAEVARAEGQGQPPPEVLLEASGKPGQVWTAQLELQSAYGAVLGPLHALRVVEKPPEPKLVQEWELRGVLFDEATARPTRELQRQLAAAVARAAADPRLHLQLEVHVAGSDAPRLSEDRARAVRDALIALGVAPERIEARGRGGEAPLLLNITEKGRQQNRRVVIRAVEPAPQPEPAPEPALEPRALVQGKAMPSLFQETVPRGQPVAVELRRADGAGLSLRAPSAPVSLEPGPLRVRVDPPLALATAGTAQIALPLLSVGVSVEGDPSLAPGGHPRGLWFALDAGVAGASEWSLSLDDGAWSASGQGAPPSKVAWPEDKVLSEGAHAVQLTVRDAAGNFGRSAPARFDASENARALWRETVPSGALFAGRAVSHDGLVKLKALLPKLQAADAGSVELEVFSDDLADAQRVTQDRAAALAKALAELGVPAQRVTARGRGAAQPIAPNATAPGRRKNNRVVFSTYPLGKGGAAAALEGLATVRIQGMVAQAEGDAFVADLPAPPGVLELEVQLGSGRSAKMSVPLPPVAAVEAPPLVLLPSGGGADGGVAATGAYPVSAGEGPAGAAQAGPAAAGAADGGVGFSAIVAAPAAPEAPTVASLLTVRLPPEGAIVKSDAFWLRGATDPRNKLALNGQPLATDAAGRFEARIPVSRGEQKISLVTTDPDGNTATLERTLTVNPDGLFVLLLGEGDAGQGGAQLDGLGDRRDLGGFFLKGRAAGLIDGSWSPSRFFKEVKLSGQFDTSRRDDSAFFRELIDPARYYPIDGDSGQLTQVAASRGPLWLSLRADDSKFVAGSFQTHLSTTSEQLFRYDRTLTGLDLDFVKNGEKLSSRISGFVAQGDLRQRHAHAELRGTGGSVFWLRNPDIIEGSERVRLVIRDARTGVELLRVDRTRDADYTLRAAEGRLVFKQPIPSVSDGASLLNANYTTPLGGNPVFVVVDYEYRGQADDGRGAGGFHVEETLFGSVTAGGGFVRENHAAGAPYQLAGAHLAYRPRPRTFLSVEAAQSKGTDAESYGSDDGGMTFGTLGANCLDRAVDLYACYASGAALRAEAAFELADWLKDHPLDLLRGSVFAERIEPGFYANGSITDQATLRGGAALRWLASEKTQVNARLDLVQSDLWLSYDPSAAQQQAKRVLRRFMGVSAQHELSARWSLTGEWLDTYTFDDQLGRAYTDQLLAGVIYKPLPWLTLTLHQEADPRADERQYPHSGDKLATTVGATLRLSEALYAQASETVRWSGENATLVGLRTPLFGAGSLYANERMSMRSGQLISTSVVGAEDKLGPTLRSYGEWQLDNQAGGFAQRAVMGLVNRFEVRPGVWISAAFERAQVLGNAGLTIPGADPGATSGSINGISPTAGPLLNPQASCIPGSTPAAGTPPQQGGAGCSPALATGSSFNPAGGYFPGASARTAGSLGIEYTLLPRLKGSAKLELRKDTADPKLIGVVAGVDDRLHFLVSGDASWKWTDDFSALGRLHLARTTGSNDVVQAEWLEATVGLALRPVRSDRFALLFKLTHLSDQRPVDLTSGISDLQVSDVISLAPTLELPFRLAIAEKLAFKHVKSSVAGGPDLDANLFLWVNRLDWHAHKLFDLSAEYRMLILRGPLAGTAVGGHGDSQRGFLAEVAWKPSRYTRLGVGWNFTSFSDDELARYDNSAGGFFVRAVGEY